MNQRNLLIGVMTALVVFIIYSYFSLCPRLTIPERVARTDAVFTAKIAKVRGDVHGRVVTMAVDRVWKGDVPQELNIPTKDFEEGTEYLLFALVYKGQYYISKCGGRYELALASEALGQLGDPLKTYSGK